MNTALKSMRRINPWKMFVGAFVPNWLLERSEISLGAKLVYAKLAQHAGKSGEQCNPSHETLGRELGIGERSARRRIAELIEFALVEQEQIGLNQTNRYYFLEHRWMNYRRDFTADRPKAPVRTGVQAWATLDRPKAPVPKVLRESEVKEGTPIVPSGEGTKNSLSEEEITTPEEEDFQPPEISAPPAPPDAGASMRSRSDQIWNLEASPVDPPDDPDFRSFAENGWLIYLAYALRLKSIALVEARNALTAILEKRISTDQMIYVRYAMAGKAWNRGGFPELFRHLNAVFEEVDGISPGRETLKMLMQKDVGGDSEESFRKYWELNQLDMNLMLDQPVDLRQMKNEVDSWVSLEC